jgi:hypothetical protein
MLFRHFLALRSRFGARKGRWPEIRCARAVCVAGSDFLPRVGEMSRRLRRGAQAASVTTNGGERREHPRRRQNPFACRCLCDLCRAPNLSGAAATSTRLARGRRQHWLLAPLKAARVAVRLLAGRLHDAERATAERGGSVAVLTAIRHVPRSPPPCGLRCVQARHPVSFLGYAPHGEGAAMPNGLRLERKLASAASWTCGRRRSLPKIRSMRP